MNWWSRMTDWRLIRPGYCVLCNQRPMSDHNFAEWLTAWARGKPYARLAEIDVILQSAISRRAPEASRRDMSAEATAPPFASCGMGKNVQPRHNTHAELLAMGPPPDNDET
jgi:hypothetical protein